MFGVVWILVSRDEWLVPTVNQALGIFRAVEAPEVHSPQSFDRFL